MYQYQDQIGNKFHAQNKSLEQVQWCYHINRCSLSVHGSEQKWKGKMGKRGKMWVSSKIRLRKEKVRSLIANFPKWDDGLGYDVSYLKIIRCNSHKCSRIQVRWGIRFKYQ